jgi:hypothetical protein
MRKLSDTTNVALNLALLVSSKKMFLLPLLYLKSNCNFYLGVLGTPNIRVHGSVNLLLIEQVVSHPELHNSSGHPARRTSVRNAVLRLAGPYARYTRAKGESSHVP